MIQVRPKDGNDRRWHSPDRDLAYCWPSLVKAAASTLAETRWEDWLGDFLSDNNITEKELGEACSVYVKAIASFSDPKISSTREAMTKAGWFDLPPAAQAAVCLKLGHVSTCAFFTSIRDVTFDGDKPPISVDDMLRDCLDSQGQLGRKTWLPSWLRRLILRWVL